MHYQIPTAIIKALMMDGSICELVKELQLNGTYRDEMLAVNDSERTVIEYERN
jgi:hypothetical protein